MPKSSLSSERRLTFPPLRSPAVTQRGPLVRNFPWELAERSRAGAPLASPPVARRNGFLGRRASAAGADLGHRRSRMVRPAPFSGLAAALEPHRLNVRSGDDEVALGHSHGERGHRPALPQSSSASRWTAGASGFLYFSSPASGPNGSASRAASRRSPPAPSCRRAETSSAPQSCSKCSFKHKPWRLCNRMLASVALRTSIGSRRRSVPTSSAGRRHRGTPRTRSGVCEPWGAAQATALKADRADRFQAQLSKRFPPGYAPGDYGRQGFSRNFW
jgi:hypothetical protein